MRKLSTWARYNPYKARIIIITGHLLLGAIACFTGPALFDMGITLSATFFGACTGVFITTALLYPLHRARKENISKRRFYIQRKTSDFIIATCSFCLMCWGTNNFHNYLPQLAQPSQASSVVPSTGKPTAQEILESLKYRDKKDLTRTEKRILRKELRHQLKVYVKAEIAGKKDDSDKALLIILSIIAAIGLLYLVGVLACSIACNGSDGAAVIFAILGTAAVIWLLVVVIKKINRGGKKKTPGKTETGLP